MPIHDWTRVTAGTFHDFHSAWIIEIRNHLNGGGLPPDYYAMAEQLIGPYGPDVLALHSPGNEGELAESQCGSVAVALAPPKVRFSAETEVDQYAAKRHSVVVRHSGGDRVVALIEIMSPGNKSSRVAFRDFVDKAVDCIRDGRHLLVVDLFPTTNRDPQGIHGAIWQSFSDDPFILPTDERLTLAAYSAGSFRRAFVEPTQVGKTLIDMPLFLEPGYYVNVPLEQTYIAAYRGVPARWRKVLD